MNTRALALLAALLLLASFAAADEIWHVDKLAAEGQPGLEVFGAPQTANVGERRAVVFDGKQDGLLVNTNRGVRR